MNWDRIEGKWKQLTGHLQERWGRMSSDEPAVATGKRNHLAGRIQEAYGISKDAAERQLTDWQHKHKHDMQRP